MLERAYRQLAHALLEYVNMCNKRHVVPLKWDINHYTARLHSIDRRAGR